MNASEHGWCLGQNLVIPKPEHAKIRSGQPRVASTVVLAAVVFRFPLVPAPLPLGEREEWRRSRGVVGLMFPGAVGPFDRNG